MAVRARRDPEGVAGDPAGRARDLALRILSAAPKSEACLRERLVLRGVEEGVIDEVIVRYREVGLLDDASLARAIARTRHRERGRSRWAIADELKRKGFRARDIESALEEISDEDEGRVAEEVASRRWEATRGLPDEARARRVAGALSRRGYPPGMAFSLVRALKDADIWDNPTREVDSAKEE